MCFRSKQFVYIYQLFVYKKNRFAENTNIFQLCFLETGLLYQRLVKFSSYFRNFKVLKKMFLPETNFDFTNVWSEMLPFRDMAISFGKFWSWTPKPCTKNEVDCSLILTKIAKYQPVAKINTPYGAKESLALKVLEFDLVLIKDGNFFILIRCTYCIYKAFSKMIDDHFSSSLHFAFLQNDFFYYFLQKNSFFKRYIFEQL